MGGGDGSIANFILAHANGNQPTSSSMSSNNAQSVPAYMTALASSPNYNNVAQSTPQTSQTQPQQMPQNPLSTSSSNIPPSQPVASFADTYAPVLQALMAHLYNGGQA